MSAASSPKKGGGMDKLKQIHTKSLLLIIVLLFAVGVAEAQIYGLLHPAKPVRHQSLMGGAYMLLAGSADIGVAGQLRYGASRNLDIGGKLGFLTEGDGGILLGGDVMGQLIHSGANSPINLSLDGSLELFFEDNFTFFVISGTGIIDDEIRLENGKPLRPYGALALNIVTIDFDTPGLGGGSDTELDITLNGGIVYGFSSQMDILGEISISSIGDGEVGINAGLNFR
jgi:hypothetical protein